MLNILEILNVKLKEYLHIGIAIIIGLLLVILVFLFKEVRKLTLEVKDTKNELELGKAVTIHSITSLQKNMATTTVATFNSIKIYKQEIKDLGLTTYLKDANSDNLKRIKQLEELLQNVKLKTDNIKGKEIIDKPLFKEYIFDSSFKYYSVNMNVKINQDSLKYINSVTASIDSLVFVTDTNLVITKIIPKRFLFFKYGVKEIVCESYHSNPLFNTSSLKVINKN
jgi:hypothetical protein